VEVGWVVVGWVETGVAGEGVVGWVEVGMAGKGAGGLGRLQRQVQQHVHMNV
jgi:hypothetical protein